MKKLLIVIILIHLLLCGCGFFSSSPQSGGVSSDGGRAADLGYVIQAGAFSKVDNAANFTARLEGRNLDPYYFLDAGLYKVRFGNFATRESAVNAAKSLVNKGILTEYYIVSPNQYAKAQAPSKGTNYLRNELVRTARTYLGVQYKWGGNSRAGIDCSGLTQAVYNLNGLSIPRNSAEQHKRGTAVSKANLKPGDLVFFATSGGTRVSHVGIYTGNGVFIHAPGQGKKVTEAKLSNSYFAKTYVGGRSYL
jgi:cell wall-associated NlpC family hydrolase